MADIDIMYRYARVLSAPIDDAKKPRIETFENKRPVDRQQRHRAETGDAADQVQRLIVDGQDGAEEDVHQVDIAALQRYQRHADRERSQIKAGKTGVFAQPGAAADNA